MFDDNLTYSCFVYWCMHLYPHNLCMHLYAKPPDHSTKCAVSYISACTWMRGNRVCLTSACVPFMTCEVLQVSLNIPHANPQKERIVLQIWTIWKKRLFLYSQAQQVITLFIVSSSWELTPAKHKKTQDVVVIPYVKIPHTIPQKVFLTEFYFRFVAYERKRNPKWS